KSCLHLIHAHCAQINMTSIGAACKADSHLPAMFAERNIKKVRGYSPTNANREAFAKAMAQKVTAEVRPVGDPEEAARGADVIATTTNSLSRVVSPEWVKPGVHLTCVRVPGLGEETIAKVARLMFRTQK